MAIKTINYPQLIFHSLAAFHYALIKSLKCNYDEQNAVRT